MADELGSLRDQLLLRELNLHKQIYAGGHPTSILYPRPKVRFEQNAPPNID